MLMISLVNIRENWIGLKWVKGNLNILEIVSVEGVRFEYGIKLVGQFWGGGKAHPHISPDSTCGWDSKEEPRRCQYSKKLEEWAFLGNCRASHLHQITEYWKRR